MRTDRQRARLRAFFAPVVLGAAAVLLVPCRAEAHGQALLVMFVYIPPLIVPGILLISIWAWKADLRAKVRTLLAVMLASGLMFALNYGIQARVVPFPESNLLYLLVVAAQILVPAAVWIWCVWMTGRKSENGHEKLIH